jgi:hypothetical protein
MADGFDNPGGRREWFHRMLRGHAGAPPRGSFLAASRRRREIQRQQRARALTAEAPSGTGANWVPLGPSAIPQGQASGNPVVSGRITALAVGPGGTRVYAGSANGGVWMTEDAGASWSPLDEYAVSPSHVAGWDADSLAVGSLAVQFGATRANDRIFVGTGEDNGNSDAYYGIGIKYSSDGGSTFSLEAPNLANAQAARIAIDPDNPNRVFAATTFGLYLRPDPLPNPPNWTPVVTGVCVTDVIIVGTTAQGNKAYYCAYCEYPGQPAARGIYTSTDGVNWGNPIALLPNASRIALAGSQTNPPVVYALGSDYALYRADGATTGFKAVSGVPADLVNAGQGFYDLVVAVDPKDADTVYLAGAAFQTNNTYDLALYRCTILNGNSASPSLYAKYFGIGAHPDAHALEFATNADGTHDPNIVWIGTDGGPFAYTPGPGSDLANFSKTGRSNFRARNIGLNITQLTYLDHRPDTDAVVYAGCQDNGTVRYIGEAAWSEAPRGDGGGIAVDPNDPLQVMRQYTNAALFRCSDGGLDNDSWTIVPFPPYLDRPWSVPPALPATPGQWENNWTGFYAPIRACADGSSRTLAAFGTFRLWITTDWGDTWTTPSGGNPIASGDLATDSLTTGHAPVTALAFASATRIYVATASYAAADNGIWRYDRNGTWPNFTWTKTPIALPQVTNANGQQITPYVLALCVHDAPAGSFYIGIGGHQVDHLWYYDGSAWSNAGNNGLGRTDLDVPVHTVVVDPAHPANVYVGTSVGVWKGVKQATPATWTWTLYSDGLPESPVLDLAIHAKGRLLRAATHGRGAWEIPLDATSSHDPDIYVRANYADSGRMTSNGRQPWVNTVPDPVDPHTTASHSRSADIKVVPAAQTTFRMWNSSPYYFPSFMGPVDHVDFAQLDVTGAIEPNSWNQIFVQIHNRHPVPFAGNQIKVLVLLADMTGQNPPALPADYATRIAAGDFSNWLGNTGWRFQDDAASRWRTLAGNVSAYSPQILPFPVNVGSPPQLCVAVFVAVPGEPLVPGITDITQLAMKDKHVAYRIFQVNRTATCTQAGTATLPSGTHSATLLADGRVLIAGGLTFGGHNATRLAATQIYDPTANTWTPGANMNVARYMHTAIRLADDRVLVFGGFPNTTDAEISDPLVSGWTAVNPMRVPRRDASAVLLSDGRVFVTGGINQAPCEIFDPAQNTWTLLPNCVAPAVQKAVGLIGVPDFVFLFPSCQIFNLRTLTLTSMSQPQSNFLPSFTITALNTGEVLITAGGYNEMEPADASTYHSIKTMTCELYTPSRDSWRTIRTKFWTREMHSATRLQDGRVLFAGALTTGPNTTIIYDPANYIWVQSPPLAGPRIYHTATLMTDGRVLIAGGQKNYQGDQPAYGGELYTPPSKDAEVVLYGST